MAKSLEFLLAIENTRFNRSLDAAESKVRTIGRKMADGLDPAINKMKAMRSGMANIAAVGIAAGAAAAVVGLAKLNGFIQESVELAGVQEQAEAKLKAVLEATGGAAGLTAEQLKEYAGRLQDITTYGDETTISAMAVLGTFKQIKGDNFKAATKAAMDMSAVMGTDLESNILQIGKALNDPIKGLDGLGRAGVKFTEQQKAQITALAENGKMMEAQKIIIAELQGQFGGAAEALRGTFGGALDAVKGRYADLKEEVGFAITNNEFFLEGLKVLEAQVLSWTTYMKENGAEVREYAKQGALALLSLAEAGLTTADFLYRGFQGIAGTFQGLAALSLGVSGGIFKIVQAGAALTDFLGITEGEFERWGIEAEGAFGAAGDLAKKTVDSFRGMVEGEPKIRAAKEALAGFRQEIENIPSDAVDVSAEAKKTIDATDSLRDGTKQYTEEMVKVNDQWVVQKREVADVGEEVKKIEQTLNRLDGREINVTVIEKLQQGKMYGGMIGMATGGYLAMRSMMAGGYFPGFGGGDRRHVVAEDGEYMLDKWRVRDLGLKTVMDLHRGRYAAVIDSLMRRVSGALPMQNGGLVGAGAAGGGSREITITFAGPGGHSPRGRFSENDGEQLVRLFQQMAIGSS